MLNVHQLAFGQSQLLYNTELCSTEGRVLRGILDEVSHCLERNLYFINLRSVQFEAVDMKNAHDPPTSAFNGHCVKERVEFIILQQ